MITGRRRWRLYAASLVCAGGLQCGDSAPGPASQVSPQTSPQTSPAPAPDPGPPNAYSFDLKARVAEFAETRPDATDGEFYIYRSPMATVHMHVIGIGQMCPLHIHRTTHEATVIVAGTPKVVHVYGEDGALKRTERRVPPGQLVVSAPLCGHEWTNVDPTPQGNLVIASPRFDGNLYLYEDDDRMLPGPAPALVDPAARLAASDAPLTIERQGFLQDQLSLLLVRSGTATVHTDPTRDTVLYVTHGQGQLGDIELRPGVAAVVRGPDPRDLVVTAPLAAWMFEPPRADGPR